MMLVYEPSLHCISIKDISVLCHCKAAILLDIYDVISLKTLNYFIDPHLLLRVFDQTWHILNVSCQHLNLILWSVSDQKFWILAGVLVPVGMERMNFSLN